MPLLAKMQTLETSARVRTGSNLLLGMSPDVDVPDRVQSWMLYVCLCVCMPFEKCELELWRTSLFCSLLLESFSKIPSESVSSRVKMGQIFKNEICERKLYLE